MTEGAGGIGGLDRIRAFLTDYHVDHGTREPTAGERQIIEEALANYLLREDSLMGRPTDRAATALNSLRHITRHLPAIARPTAKLVEQCIVDLACRVERREDANLILKEHAVMLSEDLRLLRLSRAAANSGTGV